MCIDDMFSLSAIFIFAYILCTSAINDDVIEDDNNHTIKPAELAGLVLKERIQSELKKSSLIANKQHKVVPSSEDGINNDDPDIKIEESKDDDVMLKNRKVWSRWSKWGSCSTSCGPGVTARQRACVAGHCARGEREEQRRPCCRAPCPPDAYQSRHPHEPSTDFSIVTIPF